ncbi:MULTISPECIES: hypothetical protein [Nocardiaceae]|uniref:Integral membrane protein n=1 Tax=Rhodococcoides corynebacterioides TaxID=53972 RepID=A0ABS2KUZ3_9NOCA|nr:MULTISPECIES: hypothetical protein [Rhodococcus]MBM7415738.1 hypothetical protein [Rhodococcus corynebacterioides]MBP1118200.1 hypothetical protein [Rhodococcus sp. PvP016]
MHSTTLPIPSSGIGSLTNATPLAVLLAFATQCAVACVAAIAGFGAVVVSALAAFASADESPGAMFVGSLADAWAFVLLIAAVGHGVLATVIVQRRRSARVVVTAVALVWAVALVHTTMVWPLVVVLAGSALAWWIPTSRHRLPK